MLSFLIYIFSLNIIFDILESSGCLLECLMISVQSSIRVPQFTYFLVPISWLKNRMRICYISYSRPMSQTNKWKPEVTLAAAWGFVFVLLQSC